MMRSSYHNRVKLWRDKQDLMPGRWIRVPSTTPFLPYEHPWGSRKTWDREFVRDPADVGEADFGEWSNGARPVGWGGIRICGREESVRHGGVTGVDGPFEIEEGGVNQCCYRETITLCGVRIPLKFKVRFRSIAGCACAAEMIYNVQYLGQSGFIHRWGSEEMGGGPVGAVPWGGCLDQDGDPITSRAYIAFNAQGCHWYSFDFYTFGKIIFHTQVTQLIQSAWSVSSGPDYPPSQRDTMSDPFSIFNANGTIVDWPTCKLAPGDPTRRAVLDVIDEGW